MAKTTGGLFELCTALGIERPNEVLRVVVDIDAKRGYPVMYVERIGDTNQIIAALMEPGIDLRVREQTNNPPPGTPTFRGNVSGANIAWNNGNVTQRS